MAGTMERIVKRILAGRAVERGGGRDGEVHLGHTLETGAPHSLRIIINARACQCMDLTQARKQCCLNAELHATLVAQSMITIKL
jgi:hypothetical protein